MCDKRTLTILSGQIFFFKARNGVKGPYFLIVLSIIEPFSYCCEAPGALTPGVGVWVLGSLLTLGIEVNFGTPELCRK